METLGVLIAAGLTLMVFSYIFGDNALFKLAAHVFVGVAIGYTTVVVVYQLVPQLEPGNILRVFPALILCFLLIFKVRPTQGNVANTLGSVALAFVLGVGAALAIGGALFGTLMPQVAAVATVSLNPNQYQPGAGQVDWLNNIIIVIGTIGTFFYFTFTVRATGPLGGLREGLVRFFAGMGRLVIIFTLGALFANTFSARIALLIARLQFLFDLHHLMGR